MMTYKILCVRPTITHVYCSSVVAKLQVVCTPYEELDASLGSVDPTLWT